MLSNLVLSLAIANAFASPGTLDPQRSNVTDAPPIGFWQLMFATANQFDLVALVRPTDPATVRLDTTGWNLYVHQRVKVIDSPDMERDAIVNLYYCVARRSSADKPTLADILPEDVALANRTFLLIAKKQGGTIRFNDAWQLGDFAEYSVAAIDPNAMNAVAMNFIEADEAVWSDKEDRREWLLQTIARSMPKMPDVGLRKASWLLAKTNWAPGPGEGPGNIPDYRSQQYSLYEAVIAAREALPIGRSAKARLYATFAIAALQQIDPLDTKSHPGRSEMSDAIHKVIVRDQEPVDEDDLMRFCGQMYDPQKALDIAELTENRTFKTLMIHSISSGYGSLESRGDRIRFLMLLSDQSAGTRYLGYVKLYKWLSITAPEIVVTRDRGKRVTSIDNEVDVVAGIERRLGE